MQWETDLDDLKGDFPIDSSYIESKRTRTGPVVDRIKKLTNPGDDLLSIGSGPCVIESVLSKLGYNVVAVDELKNSWHKLGDNQRRFREFAESNGVEFHQKTITPDDPLPKSDFDLVFSLDVIEHLTTPRQFLNACVFHIDDRGSLLLLTPNASHLARRLKRLLGKPQPPVADNYYWYIGNFRGHIKEYTVGEVGQMLSYQGLTNIQVDTIHQLVEYKKHTLESPLKHRLLDVYKFVSGLYPPFRDTIVATATKPAGWEPDTADVERFKDVQNLIERSNLDGLSNEEIIDAI